MTIREFVSTGRICEERTVADYFVYVNDKYPHMYVESYGKRYIVRVENGRYNNHTQLDMNPDDSFEYKDGVFNATTFGKSIQFNVGRRIPGDGTFFGDFETFIDKALPSLYKDPHYFYIKVMYDSIILWNGNLEDLQKPGRYFPTYGDYYIDSYEVVDDNNLIISVYKSRPTHKTFMGDIKQFVNDYFYTKPGSDYLTSETYPFLRIKEIPLGYRVETTFVDDYIEAFSDDKIDLNLSHLVIHTKCFGKVGQFSIGFEGDPNAVDGEDVSKSRLLRELKNIVKKTA